MGKYIIYDFLKQDFPVSQEYGVNYEYYAKFGLNGHEGIDFKTPNGTEIFSPLNGSVIRDGYSEKDYGNYLVVWDSVQQCAVWFCHLLDNVVNVGDTVKAGQLLGRTNNTGNTTGPHCHVNFCLTDGNGIRINKDNGFQGFLNMLDPNLVEIRSFPFAEQQQGADPNTIIPGKEYLQTELPADLFNLTDGSLISYSEARYVVRVNANGTRSFVVYVKPAVTEPIPTPAAPHNETEYQEMERERNEARGLLQDKINENVDISKNYSGFVALGYNTVDDVRKTLEQREHENQGLYNQIVELKKQLVSNHTEDLTALEIGKEAIQELKDIKVDHESTLIALEVPKKDIFHVLNHIDNLQRIVKKAKELLDERYPLHKALPLTEQQIQKTEKTTSWFRQIAAFLGVVIIIVFFVVKGGV